MLNFSRRKSFRKRVSDHIFSGTKYQTNLPLLDDPANEMEAHVNVLCARMVLMVLRERNGGLVVGKESRGRRERTKDFADEAAEPKCLFCGVRGGHVLALGCRE